MRKAYTLRSNSPKCVPICVPMTENGVPMIVCAHDGIGAKGGQMCFVLNSENVTTDGRNRRKAASDKVFRRCAHGETVCPNSGRFPWAHAKVEGVNDGADRYQ